MIIYRATNTVNGKMYIGKTVKTLEVRKREHLNSAKRGVETIFHKVIRKYSEQMFRWDILAVAGNEEVLMSLEKKFIYLYNTYAGSGYNMTEGGDGVSGLVCSEETRRKLSEANKGKKASEESKRKMSEARKGRKLSEEAKKKIGEVHKGRKLSEEAKKKIGEVQKGKKKHSEESRKKISEFNKGKLTSEETKQKMSEARKLYWANKQSKQEKGG